MDSKAGGLATQDILEKAVKLGASMAGVVNSTQLRLSPSHRHFQNTVPPLAEHGSLLVIGLEHPCMRPSIDWWDGNQGTAGNRKLIRIAKKLGSWMQKELGVISRMMPYHFRQSGLFVKDAAVLAGLGVIGRNNLVITPSHGPRVRFKALHLSQRFITAGTLDFHPCESCPAPCLTACPQHAFADGSFNSRLCLRQMRADEQNSTPVPIPGVQDLWGLCIKYCRACELACPVGSGH
jgi:epoxyqueuosine reductase